MTITTLDPATALVVVDLQNGTVANPAAHPIGEVVGRALELVGAFRAHGLPVVLVNFDLNAAHAGRTDWSRPQAAVPAEWSALIPELVAQPGDLLVTKTGWSAFAGTDLAPRLRDLGVTQVVVVGLATSFGVESTARDAADAGFHVTLATDAMTDPRPEAHAHSVSAVFPALAETGRATDVLALLRQRG